jgi:hypothetical protein
VIGMAGVTSKPTNKIILEVPVNQAQENLSKKTDSVLVTPSVVQPTKSEQDKKVLTPIVEQKTVNVIHQDQRPVLKGNLKDEDFGEFSDFLHEDIAKSELKNENNASSSNKG